MENKSTFSVGDQQQDSPAINFEGQGWATTDSIPTIDMFIYSREGIQHEHVQEVIGGTRKLRAQWTPELAQDLEMYHNINAEAELTRILNDEIMNALYSPQEVEFQRAMLQRKIAKRRRHKDRQIYIKMIKEWGGV